MNNNLIKIYASIQIYNHEAGPKLEKVTRLHMFGASQDLDKYKTEIEDSYLYMLKIIDDAGQFNGRKFALPDEIVIGQTCHFDGEMFAIVTKNNRNESYDRILLYDSDIRNDDQHDYVDKLIARQLT